MKRTSLFLLCFVSLMPMLVRAQPSSEEIVQNVDSYLKDLEERGYCVIPNVFSSSETQLLYERVWHDFIEKAWPGCKLNDRSNWKETFPMHNRMAIFAGPAGQTQVMWDLRQDPRIVSVFSRIWNTSDLVVSMDGLCFMCPPEIREGHIQPWPHVDQTVVLRQGQILYDATSPMGFISESPLKTQPFTIQGQFLFEDSFEGDGGFYCIPKSHLRFAEFAPLLEALYAMEMPRDERKKARLQLIEDFFNTPDASGKPYYSQHITAPKGSLILWDSRTIHWNQHPSQDRPYSATPKVRMVGYLCYVPKSRLEDASKILRKEAFDKGVSTGHNPIYFDLKYTKDHIQQEFAHYLEDPSYVQPKINLTPLGESLLGI